MVCVVEIGIDFLLADKVDAHICGVQVAFELEVEGCVAELELGSIGNVIKVVVHHIAGAVTFTLVFFECVVRSEDGRNVQNIRLPEGWALGVGGAIVDVETEGMIAAEFVVVHAHVMYMYMCMYM